MYYPQAFLYMAQADCSHQNNLLDARSTQSYLTSILAQFLPQALLDLLISSLGLDLTLLRDKTVYYKTIPHPHHQRELSLTCFFKALHFEPSPGLYQLGRVTEVAST
jgi:hypothetical protein